MPKHTKLASVNGELLSKAIQISNKSGQTVLAFTNQIFEQAIIANKLGATLPEIVDFYTLIRPLMKISVVVPYQLAKFMIESLYEIDRDRVLRGWEEAGNWLGKYISINFPNRDPLDVLKKNIKSILNIDNISINKNNGGYSIMVIDPYLSLPVTDAYSHFLRGISHFLLSDNTRYNIENSRERGIVLLRLKKENNQSIY